MKGLKILPLRTCSATFCWKELLPQRPYAAKEMRGALLVAQEENFCL